MRVAAVERRALAIDCETFLIERETPHPRVVCLGWSDGKHSAVIPHHDGRIVEWLALQLRDSEVLFVGHNIAYDFCCLLRSYPELTPLIFAAYRAGRVTDTGIRQKLISIATRVFYEDREADPIPDYGLAGLFEAIFNRPMPGPGKEADSIRYRYGDLYHVPFVDWSDEAIDYQRLDAVCTWLCWKAQALKAGHLLRDDAFQAYAYFCLALMAAEGMITDAARVAQLKAEQLRLRDGLRPLLQHFGLLVPEMRGRGAERRLVGYKLKQAPARERIVAACAKLGVDPLLSNKKQIKISRDACHWAQDSVMLLRAAYVSADKVLSTYVPVLEAGTQGRVTSRFGLAATGRTTSSTPREPAVGSNQQNQPRRTLLSVEPDGSPVWSKVGVRECHMPRPGYIYLSGDLSGAELYALASACRARVGWSTMGDVLKGGRDVHLYLACYLIGRDGERDYDDVLLCYKQGDPEVEDARQDAKPVNFGFGGFMQPWRFVLVQLKEGKRWSLERATWARDTWLHAFSEMPHFFESVRRELGANGKCVMESRLTRRLRKVQGLPMACNGEFQPPVADAAKAGVCAITEQCYTVGSPLQLRDARPVNFIHDEVIAEIRDGTPAELAPAVGQFKRLMEREFAAVVPDYPTKVDPVLSYVLSKRSKSVYNSEGHLTPWVYE